MTDLTSLSIREASNLMARTELLSVELVEAVLDRIEETERYVHAYVRILADSARAAAHLADRLRRDGMTPSPLCGVPVALKDLFFTVEAPTEAGSAVLEGFWPAYDAAAVDRLRTAGAVIIGKTVTHEFAYGMNVPPTRNPWDIRCYPGGSSAGSAVSVAVGSAFAALGSDTAGSVRTPAAVNGVVGLKPTYGRVSRHGVIPSSPSLDHVGTLTRSVADAALVLTAIVGHDPRDPASLDVPVNHDLSSLDPSIAGLRLGVEQRYFFNSGVVAGVRAAAEKAIEHLATLGAEIVEVSIPELDLMGTIGSAIMVVENNVWHRRLLRERGALYNQGTRVMLELGELIPATTYVRALRARQVVRNGVRSAFMRYGLDALVGPSIPITAPRIEAMGRGKAELSGLTHHNYPANVTGQPALSIPCGFAEGGLPVGLQLIGRPLSESTVLRIGHAYEATTNWHMYRPALAISPR